VWRRAEVPEFLKMRTIFAFLGRYALGRNRRRGMAAVSLSTGAKEARVHAEPARTLRRGVGLVGVVTFGAGTAIGVSIFTVLQPAAQLAGAGMLVAIALAALPMVLFAAA
jgi:hypothetical protein